MTLALGACCGDSGFIGWPHCVLAFFLRLKSWPTERSSPIAFLTINRKADPRLCWEEETHKDPQLRGEEEDDRAHVLFAHLSQAMAVYFVLKLRLAKDMAASSAVISM